METGSNRKTEIKEYRSRRKEINQQRRTDHPDWPSQKSIVVLRSGETITTETIPVKKLNLRHSCKYCYETHNNWWLMDKIEYEFISPESGNHQYVLCGKCEHVSREDSL